MIRRENSRIFATPQTSTQNMKHFFRWAFLGFLLLVVLVFGMNFLVQQSAKSKLYQGNQIEEIPENRVGLVLGTIKVLPNGRLNLYYQYRIQAAKELYEAGKVEYLLVSGDNGTNYYDEATAMREDLIALGVPENRIYCDYAGFRTLDSVVRSKKVFGQSKITIISQQFHNERAIFLAKWFDIEAVAYNARDVNFAYGFKIQIRELLARTKLLLDIIIGTQPKFLGEPIQIG